MRDLLRQPSLLADFERFVRAHARCGAFIWDTKDIEDDRGVEVHARCLRCDAGFLQSATGAEVTSSLVHSKQLTAVN